MREEAIKLLKELLALPTVNGIDDEGSVAEYLDSYFKDHNIHSYIDRIDQKHANVLAFIPGQLEKTVIWNGHMDVVPYGDIKNWETNPCIPTERDGRIYARGASDMKSGLAAMVYALTHLPEPPKRSIQFIGTCDEEKGGIGARRVMETKQLCQSDLMIIGEPTGLRPGVAQKGCLWLRIKVMGATSHGAYPERGVNAIHYLCRLTDQLKDYVSDFRHSVLGSSTAQVNWISGGDAYNMTADRCQGVMDVRMTPGLTADMVLCKGRQLAEEMKREVPCLKLEFQVENVRRPIEINLKEESVALLGRLLNSKGRDASPIGINYFTDASILAADLLEQKILLFGPGDPQLAHQPNEYVETEKYLEAVEILREMAVQL